MLILDSGLVSTSGAVVIRSPDFTSYSSQIAKITPHSTFASNYVVTNTITSSCPTGASFSASPTLPPIVNQNVCACMMNSLSLHRHTRTRLRNRPVSVPRHLWGFGRELSWSVWKRCYRHLWRIQHVQHHRTTFLGPEHAEHHFWFPV